MELTAREYALVEFLALHRGEVVTRTQLYEHLFDENESSLSNLLDLHVSQCSQIARCGIHRHPAWPRLLHRMKTNAHERFGSMILREVLECASPLALCVAERAVLKRQRAAAAQDAGTPSGRRRLACNSLRMIFKSIKWRLQIWYGLILVVVLAGFGLTAYQLEPQPASSGRIDDELHRRFGVLGQCAASAAAARAGCRTERALRPAATRPVARGWPAAETVLRQPMPRKFHLPERRMRISLMPAIPMGFISSISPRDGKESWPVPDEPAGPEAYSLRTVSHGLGRTMGATISGVRQRLGISAASPPKVDEFWELSGDLPSCCLPAK